MNRIVVVDGDEEVRDELVRLLSDYQVEGFSQGKDALLRIATGDVDVLIVEVHLPDMPAWELIPKVHQRDPDILLITITDDNSWETSRKVRLAGSILYYGTKPLKVWEIRRVVDAALQWKEKDRPNSWDFDSQKTAALSKSMGK